MGVSTEELEDVYRRRYAHFLRVAHALTGERERAHDAVQETFARAIRARRSFRGDGALEAWLWRTLTRVCADDRRTASRPLPRAPAPANGHPDDAAAVRAAVAALPERERLILFLRHYGDLDYESIATVAGVARGTVAATLNHAHAALRRALAETPA